MVLRNSGPLLMPMEKRLKLVYILHEECKNSMNDPIKMPRDDA